MRKLPHTRSCFVCGESNPVGLRLIMETDGEIARVEFTPKPEHAGFKNTVHGGILATLLDELMVWGCAIQTGFFSYCAELTVRFHHPLRPNETATATARLTTNRRNKLLLAEADLRTATTLLASATGKYIPIQSHELTPMTDDFIGNPEELFQFLKISPGSLGPKE